MSDISKISSGQEARLQRIKALLKKKRPKFHRPESWRYKRVKKSWRKARGIDSRTRIKKQGWPVSPSIGFRSPRQIRYQSSVGTEEVLINSPLDLSLIDTSYQVGRIAAGVGRKKKERIITEAQLLNVHIINPIVARVDLRDLEEELALDEEALEDLELSDLELSDLEIGDEEE
ncbi:MAG: eL32 family ribosomal protein [Candidatus Heimdallarchaeota archaeon]